MDVQLFVGSGVFVFGIWALKTIIGVQDVSDDEGCEEEYYEDVPAVGSKGFGKKRFRVRKRPTNSPAKREVNAKVERGCAHSFNQPHRPRSRRYASPSPLPSRKSRKGSQNAHRRLGSLSPRKRTKLKGSRGRSIIGRIDEIQESLRKLSEASGLKIPERVISLATPSPPGSSPLDWHARRHGSDSPLQYFSFPIQRSPSPYYTSASVPPTRSAPPTAIPGLPPVPYWSLDLIKTPRPSRSPSTDLRSHTQRSLSQDRRSRSPSRSSQNSLHERPPTGGRGDSGDATNIFEDRDAEILLPYGSPELKSADTDDFEELTMDALKRRLAEALTDLEIETAHRQEVDQILRDVERECRQPCVVPSLIMAVMDFPSFRELLQ
ncbi:hypothetical protein K443DRAFT_9220 [Laccaria amethystina LaAM-08-1]|uniref:Uncharacterized protein n=1 Tax=Laccaria amethystina LaAM-08-1 TaxID=1095629 RepID=A0A0C9WMR4_9AGAR|nr:hypothetical protein K443DRAFT_9220 [Laccaria amethystina LaAM-08-1]